VSATDPADWLAAAQASLLDDTRWGPLPVPPPSSDAPPVRGTLTVGSAAAAILLEQQVRAHVFADGRRPDLTTRPLRRLEQAARDAEARQDWARLEACWGFWLDAVRQQEEERR
jgi:hypothetical protein